MAFYTGYVLLPTDTYFAFKNAVLGNGYDADGYYGCQCWDLCAEFWNNIGFPRGYPVTQAGGNGSAYMCWTISRDINKGDKFDLIYNLSEIKQGDVIVWNGTSSFPDGHIGFADEDYDGSGQIAVLGQNQGTGGTPPPVSYYAGGTTANVKKLGTANFLGAFRYRGWNNTPTPRKSQNSRFPFVLYARRLREKSQGL